MKKAGTNADNWIINNCRNANSFKDFLSRCFSIQQVTTEHTVTQDMIDLIVPAEGKDKLTKGNAEKKAFLQKVLAEQGGKYSTTAWKAYSEVGRGDLEALILAGAFDIYGTDREKLLAMLPKSLEIAKKIWEQEAKRRNGSSTRLTPEDLCKTLDEYEVTEDEVDRRGLEHRLEQERAYTGCYLSDSPFAPFVTELAKLDLESVEAIREGDFTDYAMFVGLLRDFRVITVKKASKNMGREMAFMTFTAPGGELEVTAFPDAYADLKKNDVIDPTTNKVVVPYLARGKVYVVRVKKDRDGVSSVFDGATRFINTAYAA